MNYVSLYYVFAYFGLICINGGASLTQFFIDDLVNGRHWMTLEELGNFMAIAQVTPGPIGINIATFLGFQRGGIFGGLLCTIGLLTPSFILMSIAVRSYSKWMHTDAVRSLMYGIRPMTVSLILSAFFAQLGMSVLSRPLPFDALLSLDFGAFREVRVCFEMIPVLAFAIWALRVRKMSITSVIFICAGAGILLHSLPKMLFSS